MAVTAGMVKTLRQQTGAGMMECKKALVEAGADLEKAAQLLREKGAASAEKKAGRIAADGTVTLQISSNGNGGAIVEINCETDFVARDNSFGKLIPLSGIQWYSPPIIFGEIVSCSSSI